MTVDESDNVSFRKKRFLFKNRIASGRPLGHRNNQIRYKSHLMKKKHETAKKPDPTMSENIIPSSTFFCCNLNDIVPVFKATNAFNCPEGYTFSNQLSNSYILLG